MAFHEEKVLPGEDNHFPFDIGVLDMNMALVMVDQHQDHEGLSPAEDRRVLRVPGVGPIVAELPTVHFPAVPNTSPFRSSRILAPRTIPRSTIRKVEASSSDQSMDKNRLRSCRHGRMDRVNPFFSAGPSTRKSSHSVFPDAPISSYITPSLTTSLDFQLQASGNGECGICSKVISPA